jgi:beta-lactamase superfamily II metal-dependent hydrolase
MALTVYFLNVGHGDCTIIEHPSGRLTMIDINNTKTLPESDVDALADALLLTKSAFRAGGSPPAGFTSWEDYYQSLLVDPVEFFRDTFGTERTVFRYIQSHPDMDHMSGLFRFFWQEGITVQNMWDTAHTKTLDESSFENTRYDHLDWLVYQVMRAGRVKEGDEHKVLPLHRGAAAEFYNVDDIELLAPTPDLVQYANDTENWNNLSYVLRISHGGRSIILPGDAEKPVWDKIESFDNPGELACDVLKAAHHGRESGYSESAVDLMDPSYVVCSIGKKPSTDASDEYASHGATVLSTRYHGTIVVTIDDTGEVEITDRNGSRIGYLPALQAGVA